MEVGLGPGDFVLEADPAPPKRDTAFPLQFSVHLLWPNGWMHQDTTWYGGRPQPRRHCVRWEPSSLPPKGAPPTIFGPCPLWPNGWMDHDATWYGCRPQPRRRCVRWGPSSSPPVFGPCLLWPNSWMYQNATWYGGRPQPRRHCVRQGPSSPPTERGTASPAIFGPCLLWPRSPMSSAAELLLDMSQLLQLDPCDVVRHTHRVVDKGGHSVW